MASQGVTASDARASKRRYAASCEVCRRQKKRCEGRDDNGVSLCTYCPRHNLECRYPAPHEQSKLDLAVQRSDGYEALLDHLAGASPTERDAILLDWRHHCGPQLPSDLERPRKRRRKASHATSQPSEPGPSPSLRSPDSPGLPHAGGLLMLAESATQASEASNMPQWLAHIFQLLEDDGVAGGLLPAEVDNLLDSFFSFHNPRFRIIDERRFRQLSQPGTVTLAQSLLLLSNYHASLRRQAVSTQLQSLARTVVDDLLASSPLLSPSSLAPVHDLAWSLYAYSVYHNLVLPQRYRSCTRPAVPLLEVQDGNESWAPVWLPDEPMRVDVAPQTSFERTCFAQSCRLYAILDDIFEASPGRQKRKASTAPPLAELRDRLDATQAELPVSVLVDCGRLPSLCPPLHILHLNVLLRVCSIVLYQSRSPSNATPPLPGASVALATATADVQTLSALASLHYPTRLSFLFVYAAFSGAAIDLDALRSPSTPPPERERIAVRLGATLDALSLGQRHILGVDGSIALLRRQRDAALVVAGLPPSMPLPVPQPEPPGSFEASATDSASTAAAAPGLDWLLRLPEARGGLEGVGDEASDWDATLQSLLWDIVDGPAATTL